MKGYDNLALYVQILLDLPFDEGVGGAATITKDIARPHHDFALRGPPTWTTLASGLVCLDFNDATPDFLDCSNPDTADLDFTTEDVSMVMWVNVDDLALGNQLMCRGLLNTDGWYWDIRIDGSVYFTTSQAAAFQTSQTAAASVAINTWYLLGITRSGADIALYSNGVDVTDTEGVHIDPLTAARELHIGIYDDETTGPFDGTLWRPRIWERQLTAQDMLMLFDMERHWLGY